MIPSSILTTIVQLRHDSKHHWGSWKVIFSPLDDLYPTSLYGLKMQNMFFNNKICADAEVNVYDILSCFENVYLCSNLDFDLIYNVTINLNSTFWIEMKPRKLTYHVSKSKSFHLHSNCSSKF